VTDALDSCLDSYVRSAVRLETLQSYTVPGEEAQRIAAWKAGHPRPERSVRTSSYLREVAQHTLAGKQRARIRVIDHPISEYVRYELGGLIESQAAGEQIHIAVRRGASTATAASLLDLPGDFWLFDQDTPSAAAVLMSYADDGTYLGCRLASHAELTACQSAWKTATRCATPLNTYLAGHGTEPTR
jgi:hypothetical protein